ncbi:Cof-type HAD-IIB family hydrolase [Clostridium sp. AL.422]|uniref:Cof-type HAD-IIB family hydrolase n=1 Tax=Clostridium TaxID=1485 RepID=UPI00293DDEE5|nr:MULTISPECIES: Cof-type HAD-IIB family hydrolase [unclassified Clostridium]MDV4150319.1 Cof-type HAD-IIB family hydrolase [Clostridium sp. AL.422]
MKNDIKLICIDMDGTLLTNDHEVTDRNKVALRKAKELGVNIAITTGRLFSSAKYYSDLIGIDTAVIASNGAYIKTNFNNDTVYETPLPRDIVLDIYNIVKKHGLSANFNSWDTLIRENEIPDTHAYNIMNKDLPDEKKVKFLIDTKNFADTLKNFKGNILKSIVIDEKPNKENLWAAKNELKETYGDTLHVVSSGRDNFEVILGTTSKGIAVSHLAKTLDIKPNEVMCIGDSENDLSMINYAGIGVAMGNGLELVKDQADYVTDTNNNSGVAKAIEHFVLNA